MKQFVDHNFVVYVGDYDGVFCKYDGCVSVSRLTSHPKYEELKDEMDSGEMVSLFGSDWVKEEGTW